jgi:FkbM family methyltransferase
MSQSNRVHGHWARLARAKDVYRDFRQLIRVCGPMLATRWLIQVFLNARRVLLTGNLQSVDAAMGKGPFRCRRGSASALLVGPQVMSGIREIWCRDVYLGRDLAIRDGDTVVDLGANMGNFTMMALAHGPNVRVVAVEPDLRFNGLLRDQLRLNGWEGRCTLIAAFVGEPAKRVVGTVHHGSLSGPRTVSEATILEEVGQDEIAFVKCDVEGGEYALFSKDSQLVARARQLSFELHYQDGNKDELLARLENHGFHIRCERPAEHDGVYHAVRQGTEAAAPPQRRENSPGSLALRSPSASATAFDEAPPVDGHGVAPRP